MSPPPPGASTGSASRKDAAAQGPPSLSVPPWWSPTTGILCLSHHDGAGLARRPADGRSARWRAGRAHGFPNRLPRRRAARTGSDDLALFQHVTGLPERWCAAATPSIPHGASRSAYSVADRAGPAFPRPEPVAQRAATITLGDFHGPTQVTTSLRDRAGAVSDGGTGVSRPPLIGVPAPAGCGRVHTDDPGSACQAWLEVNAAAGD
jgi:hypothetical protein